MSINIERYSALIVVDPQNDYFTGGALALRRSEEVLPVIQQYINKFTAKKAHIFFTRAWHAPDHCTFESEGGLWPAHCVQQTPGAAFHPRLNYPLSDLIVVSKGNNPLKSGYSGFEDSSLHAELRGHGIRRVHVCGYTTDYAVRETVVEGAKLGYEMFVLIDGTEGVNLKRWDSRNAICDMVDAGARKAAIGDFR